MTMVKLFCLLLVTTDPPPYKVWEYMFTTRTTEGWVNGSAGITGVLLLLILIVMFVLSQPFVRRRGFFEVRKTLNRMCSSVSSLSFYHMCHQYHF